MSDVSQGEIPPSECILCGLPVRSRADGFCCEGCRHAYEIISVLDKASDSTSARESEGPGAREDLEFGVRDMACPSCALLIEHVLNRSPGVADSQASFAADRVRVRYDPSRTGPGEIGGVVRGLGYRLEEGPGPGGEGSGAGDWIRLGISMFLTANVMMLAFALDIGFFRELPSETIPLLGVPMMLMASLVVVWGGGPIHRKALNAARWGKVQMETLISAGSLLAFGFSMFNLVGGNLHLYFDTASMLVTLILLGTFIEEKARKGVKEAIGEIEALIPAKGRVLVEGGYDYLPRNELRPGLRVFVMAGETVPADGTVVEGDGILDRSMLTGEPEPVPAAPGDAVLGATILVEGSLELRIEREGSDTAAGRMVTLMEEAVSRKTPFERVADRFAPPFVLGVIAAAALAAAAVAALGGSADEAVVRAVTILVVACPCTLGIAIPLAKVAAVGAGRRAGVLVRDPDAFELARRIDCVVFDKTGTATEGRFGLSNVTVSETTAEEALSLAAALEGSSKHPIARSIAKAAKEKSIEPGQATSVEERGGLGVLGEVDGVASFVGSRELLGELGVTPPASLEAAATSAGEAGLTPVWVGRAFKAVAVLELGDKLRVGLVEMVQSLKSRGIVSRLLSGDAKETTRTVAARLGVDGHEGGALPERKVEVIRTLREEGYHVAMVGDGVNDAPALAEAHVGMAVGHAWEVAKRASSVTLLGPMETHFPRFFALSERTMRTVRANLSIALLYNAVALPLAVAGWITPLIAVSAMLVSSLTVVANSSRILRKPLE
ncbi:MAG: heavy metal translocating P-type ATPase [Planctomycetota bacterium]|jgi:heavy metal translocating P-type ATPase